MKIIKKLLIIILIATIIMPILPPKIVLAETDEERKAREDYLEKYVRAYVQEAHSQSPRPVVYNGKSPSSNPIYSGVYFQNEWPISRIGSNGSNGTRSYSNTIELVCSSFTAAMLHHAWGAEIVKGTDTNTIRRCRICSAWRKRKRNFSECIR